MIAIIGILLGMLLPAVQQVRETARRASCANNMRQIAIAMANFESTFQRLPSSFDVPISSTVRGSWSVHAKLLPYMEGANAHDLIDFEVDWHEQVTIGVPAFKAPVFSCGSDFNSGLRYQNSLPYVHSTSYGFNMGSWLVHDPVSQTVTDGVFRVNKKTKMAEIRDGLSNTLCAADVKSFTPYIRNVDTIDPQLPANANHFEGVSGELRLGSTISDNTGHTVWCDGRVHHTGFTTVFGPNTKVNYTYQGRLYDIDFNSQQEGRHLTRPTFAAVTARSYHPSGINIARMDGSVDFISSSIDLIIWRALGTAADGEVLTAFP